MIERITLDFMDEFVHVKKGENEKAQYIKRTNYIGVSGKCHVYVEDHKTVIAVENTDTGKYRELKKNQEVDGIGLPTISRISVNLVREIILENFLKRVFGN